MPGGTQKYEREIAEILERLERDEPRAERVKRQARQSLGQRWQIWRRGGRGWPRLGMHAAAWRWIGLTLAAGIAGILLYPLSPLLGVACGVIMVILFFSPLLGALGNGPRQPSATMWRGKVIDLPPRGNLFARLGYHWRRLWRGRS